ncbi:MAG TPA: toll/interleukin-1 receptor domain-containing protein [Thermoanaerobaculia bacterium]|nr:toll/interleukin-1 receptor domain-containing protein [Thermoanaerobaculia bacterium]
MPRVFVSHSSRDKSFVRPLVAEMRRYGLDVWFDESDLHVGDVIDPALCEGIDASDFVVVVLSPASVDSPWVAAEWRYGCGKEAECGKPTVVPILLERCTMPPPLKAKKYADFTGNRSHAFVSLLEAIRPLELVHRSYTVLKGRTVDIGRRGHSVTEGPQRIMTLIAGGDEWAAVALLETVGPRDAAIRASAFALGGINAYFESLDGELDPEYMVRHMAITADTAIRYVRTHEALEGHALGGSCAVAVQTRGILHTAALGRAGALCHWSSSSGSCFLPVQSDFTAKLVTGAGDPGFALTHPLGYLADGRLEFGVHPTEFRTAGDFVLLLSRPLPDNEQARAELCSALDGRADGHVLVAHVCNNQAPPTDDFMVLALRR